LATFSGIFDEVPQSNERSYIEHLIEQCGFEPSILAADQCDPFQAPPELVRTQSEAHNAANMFVNWGLYEMARQRGVRVMLDGFDGDTTISHGTTYLTELARSGRWLQLVRLVPAAAGVHKRSQLSVFWSYLWQDGLLPRVPHSVQRLSRGVRRRLSRLKRAAPAPCCVLNPKFSERIGVAKYRASLRDDPASPMQTERASHYQKLTWAVMPATLEMLDHVAAPFGVEVRFPFWDRRLVEFCLGLPPGLKIRGGYTRWIMRKAMEGILPRAVQWRPDKSDLSHAFKHCLVKNGRQHFAEADAGTEKWLQPYLCPRHLDYSRRNFCAQAADEETLFLWQVANLTFWLERTGLKA